MEIVLVITIMLIGFALMFGVIFLVIRWQAKRAQQNGTWMAQELRLDFKRKPRKWLPQFGEPYLEGTMRGLPVQISTYTTSAGQSQQTWCQAILRIPQNRGLKLTISQRGLLSGVTQLFSSDVVKTGDEKFDKSFVLKCNAPAFIEAALFPEMRAQFAGTWTRHGLKGSITLNGNILQYLEQGNFANKKTCQHVVPAMGLLLDVATWVDAYNETLQS